MKDDLVFPSCLAEDRAFQARYIRGGGGGCRGGGSRITTHDPRITVLRGALFAALLACAGCGAQPHVFEGNYLTYEHAFTDEAAAAVRKNADGWCRQRSLVAVPTTRACSLTQCTTSYQCVADKPITLPPDSKK